MDKLNFFLKLNPPRTSFTVNMTEAEREIMKNHVEYWKPYIEDETVLVLGPVADPKGGYGIAVVAVESEDDLKQLIANDPANGLNQYEYYPMRVSTKQKKQ